MRFALATFGLFVASASIRAEVRDIADLFPANMLIYAEVNQPVPVAKDLLTFLKGTRFDNAVRNGPTGGPPDQRLGLLGSLLTPEFVKELPRFKGVAGGIVGYSKEGEPEYLFVILPGDGKLAEIALKAYLTSRPAILKIATVEGIELRQGTIPQYQEDPLLLPGSELPAPKTQPAGPIYVNHPEIIIIGSNRAHVTSVIHRLKGKETSPSFSGAAAFALLKEQRAKPGILFLADVRRVLDQIDRNERLKTHDDRLAWFALKHLVPHASMQGLAGRLELTGEGVHIHARLRLHEQNSSPLAKLLESAVLTPADMKRFSANSPLSVSLALPPGEQRALRFLAVLDALIKATGTLGPDASDIVRELEEQKLLSRSDLARINRVGFTFPSVTAWPKNQTPWPLFQAYADDPDVLARLEAAVPTILELLGGAKGDPVTESIDGKKIRSLAATASPLGQQVHYGRRGNAFSIGADRKLVAAALDTLKNRISPEVEAVLNRLDKPALVGLCDWPRLINGPILLNSAAPRQGTALGEIPLTTFPYFPPQAHPHSPGFGKDALRQFDGLPPLVVAMSVRGSDLVVDLHQADPNRIRAAGINHLVEWFLRGSASPYNHLEIDGSIDIQPQLPPPPLPLPPLP